VGGTNTDAVLMDGLEVVSFAKTPTTPQVTDGITTALREIVNQSGLDVKELDGVMIGTTHFTNAVVERKRLEATACIRLGLPATACLPPMVDWPDELRDVIGETYYLAHGGHEFDGREISPFDPDEIRGIVNDIKAKGIKAIAISSVFSPVNSAFEDQAAAIVKEIISDAHVTLSSAIG
ncbi:MAG: hydantoinase/oxoprolinase family protein, partial [Planctomycetes bacterium]|nr:hydantoinase/oxoprolinase family protein [Planctomycetota bacterium]